MNDTPTEDQVHDALHPIQTACEAPARTWRSQKLLMWGFIVGVAITVPATVFAFLAPAGETLQPYLVPGTRLLRPLADMVATWPGMANVAIASAINGVMYAIGAVFLGCLLSMMRRQRPPDSPPVDSD